MLTPLVTSIRSLRRSRTLRRQIQTRTKTPPRRSVSLESGRERDSNSRPQPWQGCALPTELFPLGRRNSTYSKDGVKRFFQSLRGALHRVSTHGVDPLQHPANRWIHVLRGCSISSRSTPCVDSGSASSAAHARAQRSSSRRLGQAACRYCRPDHRVSTAAMARVQSPIWNTGQPIQMSSTGTLGPPNTAGTAARPSARWS